MDLRKIGQYIASKRKEQGLTQVELAEKLGMSNKSVSKWERGVCLPDVSIYTELCDILGISLNEFIAGEDLAEDRMLLFDEELMSFAMGNCITLEDTNGNRKLYKKRYEQKIDAVAAMMDAYVAYKLNRDAFE